MAAASNNKCDAKIQKKIGSIEQRLKQIFSEQQNADSELHFLRISKKSGKGNIFPIYFTNRKPVKNGLYLITLNLPGNANHGILLFISQDNNGQHIFNLFEPNGQKWANDPSFYQIEINVNGNVQFVNTSLSPTSNVNGTGNCGIWGIVISILLNSLLNQEISQVEKDNFFRFLNENNTNGVRFITNISNTYFNSERDLDVKLFREQIIDMIKNVDNLSGDERAAEERGGKKIKIKKKKSKGIKKSKGVKKGKKSKKKGEKKRKTKKY